MIFRKYILFSLSIILSCSCFGQENDGEDRYYFQTNIADATSLTVTQHENGLYKIESLNPVETNIYSKYKVYDFKISYPDTETELIETVHTIVTNRVELLGALLYNFPEKYTRIDQFYPNEEPYYPNDYGSTSPIENLGKDLPLYDLDLVNAPGAWGITKGNKKVVLGISDGKIDSTDVDLRTQVTNFLKYFNVNTGLVCTHGSNVAGIAASKMDNAHGRSGICSDCTVIADGYGNFNYIEDLVASGARVVNTSWALCNMGLYHENIEARINEYYEDGIMIVAGAGNGKNCNPDDDYAPDDYAYPASFEKVISVTGVFTQYDRPKDNTFIGKEGKPATSHLKDRHSREYAIKNNGELFPKYNKWDMQFNESIDICAPAITYLLGGDICKEDNIYGGATSATAPFITGTIGLMLSVNYCLSAYEVESILKLTAADIERLNGNQFYKGKLGAGRVDVYKAVKMSRDMKEPMGKVHISGRDFHRFNFKLENYPYEIEIKNQTFRDSASVDFKARNAIVLKPNTVLRPDKTASVRLSIDPLVSTAECFPKIPKYYERVRQHSNTNQNNQNIKHFNVAYDSNTGTIEIAPKKTDIEAMDGISYNVMVVSQNDTVLSQKLYKYPTDAVIRTKNDDGGDLKVLIIFNNKREIHEIEV